MSGPLHGLEKEGRFSDLTDVCPQPQRTSVSPGFPRVADDPESGPRTS